MSACSLPLRMGEALPPLPLYAFKMSWLGTELNYLKKRNSRTDIINCSVPGCW